MSVRRTALEALMDVTDKGAYANLRLKEALKGLSEQDAGWVTAAVYTTLDHLLYIDHIIAAFAKGRIKPHIRGILRLGICQSLYMNVPYSAACNESVKLTKEIGKAPLAGFVNGVMRNFCRNINDRPPLPEDPLTRLSIQYSCPEYIVREYLSLYGRSFTEALLADSGPKTMTIRAQHPYTSDMLQQDLDRRGVGCTRGELVPDAFKLAKGMDISSEELFTSGKIAVQSESAMLVCRALKPKPGMRVLDACAAPGGKSAYIASLTENSAFIDAWELHPHRGELTRHTFERLGVNGNISVRDAGSFDSSLKEFYDAVLIDAPCSGLGVPGKPDARYAKSDEIIAGLADVQKKILSACCEYVRPGGTLVYATCTISQRENEQQITEFLSAHTEFEPGDISDILPKSIWKRVSGGCMLQLFPHLDGTEGFFFTKLIRSL